MSALERYKKKGGFLQLLKLIETSGISKQEKFISLIEQDSPEWARAVREKLLTLDKLANASDQGVMEVFSNIKDLTLATASFGMKQEKWERIVNLLNGPKRRKVLDQKEILSPGEGEITTAIVQILDEVRNMADRDKQIFELIDPKLKIEDGLENHLLGMSSEPLATTKTKADEVKMSENIDDEIFRLRKKIKDLQNEVDRLKVQNHDLKGKIERIQKIAS